MLIQNRIRQIIFAVALAATLLALFMGSLIPTARADGIVVTSAADNTTPGGGCTLREAIINANNDAGTSHDCSSGSGADTITFDAALGDITLLSALPVITGNLTINGLKGMTGKQNISGADAYRVFGMASGATFNLSNVRVTNGARPTGRGGGLYICDMCVAVVNTSVFSNNSADDGGAIYNGNVLTVTESAFISNTATSGGGAIINEGTLVVSSANFISNTAQYGGGIRTGFHSEIVSNATFTGNSAERGGAIYGGGLVADSTFTHNSADQGGAIFTQSSSLTLDHSDLVSNTAQFGGAAAVWGGGALTVIASTFVTNSAAQYGGAIFNVGVLTLTNSTVVSNNATIRGGALYSSSSMAIFHSTFSGNGGPSALYSDTGTLTGTLTLANSIVAHSVAANCGGTITDGGHNLQYGGTTANSCGASIETANPQLGALADNGGETLTMALPEGSAALNRIPGAGGCGVGVTTDQRGVTRPQNWQCEIGAYEKEEQSKVFLPVVLKQS